jgi:membrane protease YdiL (CAAX protease family)
MFLPLSLVLGLILHWRPRLLPYLAVVHALMDLSLLPLLLLAVR